MRIRLFSTSRISPTAWMIGAALLAGAPGAHAADSFRISSGATYTTGDYGTDTTTNVWHMPLTARYRTGPVTATASVPYMYIERRTSGQKESSSGHGDIMTSLRLRLMRERDYLPQISITGKARWATADSDLNLPNDNVYYGEFNLGKGITDRSYLFGTVGYQTRKTSNDDPALSGRDDRFYGSIGLNHQYTARTSAGLMLSAHQAWSIQAVEQGTGYMAIPYLNNSLGENWNLQSFGIIGLSTASPDWGLGFSVGYEFL